MLNTGHVSLLLDHTRCLFGKQSKCPANFSAYVCKLSMVSKCNTEGYDNHRVSFSAITYWDINFMILMSVQC